MTTLYIVRHGNTFDPGEEPRRIGRRTDLPLSLSGRAQANRLGEYFSRRGVIFSHVLAAPLKRTTETAHEIVAYLPKRPAITPDQALLEIDYGPDENQRETDVVSRIGAAAMDKWNADATPPADWDADPIVLTDGWRALFVRIGTMESAGAALAVTSNGVARFALDAATKIDPTFPKKLRTGALGRIGINGTDAVVAEWDVRP